MGEVIPLRKHGHASGSGDYGRWCSTCGAKRDASPSCPFCGSSAWQTFPVTTGGATGVTGNVTFSNTTAVSWI